MEPLELCVLFLLDLVHFVILIPCEDDLLLIQISVLGIDALDRFPQLSDFAVGILLFILLEIHLDFFKLELSRLDFRLQGLDLLCQGMDFAILLI